jgi:cellulose synthase/poly-beta-1,6-N-acetylglucosamine synthase-like glycosyltransferase
MFCMGMKIGVLCHGETRKISGNMAIWRIFRHTGEAIGTADGGTVVKVLFYKSEGRWFDSRWCHWNFPIAL